ncbi:hypothetical protein ACQ4PT_014674 [Festuca glaucescens]
MAPSLPGTRLPRLTPTPPPPPPPSPLPPQAAAELRRGRRRRQDQPRGALHHRHPRGGLLHLRPAPPPGAAARQEAARPPRRRLHLSGARPGGEAADAALQRQLQQLFHLHDSGLDQAFIDALPVFSYREIVVGVGDKEPFDCAVCLCEFGAEDRLRLLPLCGHAFHLNCIDTWLLSNSTCPLCRGVLFAPGLTAENNPMFDFDEGLEEGRLSDCCEDGFGLPAQKSSEGNMQTPVVAEKRVFPVRLGKFKNVGTQGAVEGGNAADSAVLRREEGESSSSSLDARKCFSMGTYQYVLGTSELQVALQPGRARNGAGGTMRPRPPGISCVNADIIEGKKICARNKGESFSMSKIWQWSNLKGKLPAGSDDCSEAGSLPWMKRGAAGDKSNM